MRRVKRAPIHWRDELAALTARYDRAVRDARRDRNASIHENGDTDLHDHEQARCIERLADIMDERAEEITGWLYDLGGGSPDGGPDRDTLIARVLVAREGDRLTLANLVMGTFRSLRERERAEQEAIEIAVRTPMSAAVFCGRIDDAPIEEPERPIVLPDGTCVPGRILAKITARCPPDGTIRIESRAVPSIPPSGRCSQCQRERDAQHACPACGRRDGYTAGGFDHCGITSWLVIDYRTPAGRGSIRLVGLPGRDAGLHPEHVELAERLAAAQREPVPVAPPVRAPDPLGRTCRIKPADLAVQIAAAMAARTAAA